MINVGFTVWAMLSKHKESLGFHGIIYVSEQDTFFHPGRGTVQDQDLTSVTRPPGHMLVPNSVTFARTTGKLGTQIFLSLPSPYIPPVLVKKLA